MAFAKKNGIDILDTYIDRALSAKTDKRPEFQEMTENTLKCKYNGSAVPYGYRIDEDKHYKRSEQPWIEKQQGQGIQ